MSKYANSIRIIAGQWRGRRLSVIDSDGLRPTTDRVRETLFNWLMHEVPKARCLDLFAGTGALGLEALSRAASEVVFTESSRTVAAKLEENISILSASQDVATVVKQDALSYLKTVPSKPFDIVFLDPPFDSNLLIETVALLGQAEWLADPAFIYIEQDNKSDVLSVPTSWQLYRQGKTGQSRYSLYLCQSK